jgi:hypothetical protein
MGLKAKTTRRDHHLKDQAIEEATKEEVTRLNADIPVSLHKKIKMRSAQEGSNITSIIIKAVTAYLETSAEDD